MLLPLPFFLCPLCEFYREVGHCLSRRGAIWWLLKGCCTALPVHQQHFCHVIWIHNSWAHNSLLLPALFPPQVQLALQAGSSGEKQAVESKMLPEQLKGKKNWLTSEEWQAWAAVERGLHLFHCLYLGRLGREQKGGKKCFLSLWEWKARASKQQGSESQIFLAIIPQL